jgi:hypothetical protein
MDEIILKKGKLSVFTGEHASKFVSSVSESSLSLSILIDANNDKVCNDIVNVLSTIAYEDDTPIAVCLDKENTRMSGYLSMFLDRKADTIIKVTDEKGQFRAEVVKVR